MPAMFNIWVTIKTRINSLELYKRLQRFNANVTDLGDTVYIYAQIEASEILFEDFLGICREYGDLTVEAQMTRKAPTI